MESRLRAAAADAPKLSRHTLVKDRYRMPACDGPSDRRAQDGSPPKPGPRRVKVSELLAGEREAILEHGGQDYRLRITASGKLILTK
jgi:hemin uptake protein HemP